MSVLMDGNTVSVIVVVAFELSRHPTKKIPKS